MTRTLVFTRTKRGADRVAKHLEVAGIKTGIIHGDKSQRARQDALEALRASEIRVLVATDIAARGIDIDGVSHVVNYELPDVPESYVHRIGRTARAGATGIAISLVDQDEHGQLRDIERVTRQRFTSEDRRGDTALATATGEEPKRNRSARPAGARGGNGGGQGQSRSWAPRVQGGDARAGTEARRPRRKPAPGGRGAARSGSAQGARSF